MLQLYNKCIGIKFPNRNVALYSCIVNWISIKIDVSIAYVSTKILNEIEKKLVNNNNPENVF